MQCSENAHSTGACRLTHPDKVQEEEDSRARPPRDSVRRGLVQQDLEALTAVSGRAWNESQASGGDRSGAKGLRDCRHTERGRRKKKPNWCSDGSSDATTPQHGARAGRAPRGRRPKEPAFTRRPRSRGSAARHSGRLHDGAHAYRGRPGKRPTCEARCRKRANCSRPAPSPSFNMAPAAKRDQTPAALASACAAARPCVRS